MKNRLLILLAPFLFSCQERNTHQYAILSGKALNTETKELAIYQLDGKLLKTISLHKDDTFKDTIPLHKEGTVRIGTNGQGYEIYLDKGYDLELEFDAEDIWGSMVFKEGDEGTEFNQYLLNAKKKWSTIQGKDVEAFYQLGKEDFKKKVSAIIKGQEELLATVGDIPESLRERERRSIGYLALYIMRTYDQLPWNKGAMDSTDYSDVLGNHKNVDYTNEGDFDHSIFYTSLVRTHYNEKARELATKDSMDTHLAFFGTIREIPSEKIRNDLLYTKISREIVHTDKPEEMYKRYMALSTDKEYNRKITESYQKLTKTLTGKPSPLFTAYDNHAGGTTSLEDLKGNYLYIDVWATWCGPCLQEIPALQKLAEGYSTKNIRFVSISIDHKRDYEKWRQMVVDKQLEGVQLFADNAWESTFIQDYQITGIPRFILLDPEGNIVANNAPYPSDPKLQTLLEKSGI